MIVFECMLNTSELMARAARGVEGSEIRKLLSLGKIDVGMGGGYPSPDSFPMKDIAYSAAMMAWHLRSNLPYVLQYGATEGYKPFTESVCSFLDQSPSRRIKTSPENILITTGSQQALYLLGAMFIDPGDNVGVEIPTYLGALQAFNYFQPHYIEIPTDSQGIIPDALAEISRTNRLKFVYGVPTYQNPTGKAASLKRKEQLANVITKYDLLFIEDDPYSEIQFSGETSPSIQSLAPGNVIHLFTFSKTLAPAFRLGGLVALDKETRDAAARLKQGIDLNTGYFNQAIADEYIRSGRIWRHLPEIRALYQPKQQAMLAALQQSLPECFDFTRPEGGMFEWVFLKPEYQELAPLFDPGKIRDDLLKHGIGIVPGTPFFANKNTAEKSPSFRLNFTYPGIQQIDPAIKTFGQILQSKLP